MAGNRIVAREHCDSSMYLRKAETEGSTGKVKEGTPPPPAPAETGRCKAEPGDTPDMTDWKQPVVIARLFPHVSK